MKSKKKLMDMADAAEKLWLSLTPEQQKKLQEGIERDLSRGREKRVKA